MRGGATWRRRAACATAAMPQECNTPSQRQDADPHARDPDPHYGRISTILILITIQTNLRYDQDQRQDQRHQGHVHQNDPYDDPEDYEEDQAEYDDNPPQDRHDHPHPHHTHKAHQGKGEQQQDPHAAQPPQDSCAR